MLHYCDKYLRIDRLRNFVEGQVAEEVNVFVTWVKEFNLYDIFSLHEV